MKTKYEVVEYNYDDGENPVTVATFDNLADAKLFGSRHYETQLGYEDTCTCTECVEGWKVASWNRKSYAVEVWSNVVEVVC